MKGKPELINPLDWKYMQANPHGDQDFDPEHNKRVIEASIKETDRMARQKEREYQESIKERATAAATWMKSDQSNIKNYFGPKELARLRGEEVLATIKKLKGSSALADKAKKRV